MLARIGSGFTYANVMATVAVFLALGGGAFAATSLIGSDGQIHGCVTKKGQLTVPKPGKKCAKGTTAIAWNQKGPIGPQGVKGDQGQPATNATHATSADSATNAGNADMLDNKDSTSFALRGSEPWQDAALNDLAGGGNACHWLSYGGSQNPAGYFRDSFGVVHLRGLVRAAEGIAFGCGDTSADGIVFSLPAGYEPDHDWAFATVSNDKPARVNLNPAGAVFIEANFPTWPDAKQWVSLDGLTFRCGPSGQNGCP
jgi:hypothetical protein